MPPQSSSERNASAALLLLTTEQKVHAYDLAEFSRVGIGRHESNEIQLVSRTVSNFHAEILKEDGSLVVRDLGSTNGTRVNGQRVERVKLSPGDCIRIGNHVLSLQLQAALEAGITPAASVAMEEGFGPGARGRILGLKARAVDSVPAPPASARGEVTLSELLRRLAARPESLRAILEREEEKAHALFHGQRLFHVELGSATGEKALY
ncbi:MAG: FHA domain-containing protein, partial [Vicinamibacteria bacterium]